MSVLLYNRKPRTMNDFQQMNSLQMWMAGCKREMFGRFNRLGLCVGITATKSAIDRIRAKYDADVQKWNSTVTNYMLLPSDTSTSATIEYGAITSASMSIDSTPSLSPMPMSPVRQRSPVREQPQVQLPEQSSDESSTSRSVKPEHRGRFGYSLCFDNVNQKLTVRHQARDKNNKMFNMVQAYAALDRISTVNMSDEQPSPQDILNIPLQSYIPSEMDEVDLLSEMTTMVSRVLAEHIKVFQELNVTRHIAHRYSQESASKSVMVPIGVIDKDESKVADTIEILEAYQKYVPVKPNGDPLILPLHADGLSCERGNDAQSARINGESPWTQLLGFVMNIQEWHKRCLLLQDVFDELYSGSSGRDKGTLFQLKNFFNHRNVTNNVKESFNYNEEFLEFCCHGYIVLTAMHLMKTSELHETPDEFPECKEDQQTYFESIASRIMDIVYISSQSTVKQFLGQNGGDEADLSYCLCKQEKPGETMIFCDNKHCNKGTWFHLECMEMEEEDIPDGPWFCSEECQKNKGKKPKKKKTVADSLTDHKRNYIILLMWRGLNQIVRKDAIRENDGDRILLHWRFDMLQFFEKHHPKYFLICHRLLSSTSGAVSSRLQHTLKWNRTVNPNGGKGKNIAMDLQMEFFNKAYKESVKGAAGQLTDDTIARHSQMAGISDVLNKVYENQVSGLGRRLVQKTGKPDRNKDISEFVSLLLDEDLLTNHPGRCFASYPELTLKLYTKLQPKALLARLERIRKEMSKRRQLSSINRADGQ